MASKYQFKIQGQLDIKLSAWFDGFVITYTPEGDSLLTGEVIDQAALHGVFARCRDLGVTLISVNRVDERQGESKMNQLHVEASKVIDAQPEVIHRVIIDYRGGHRAILPKPFFTKMEVEQGGMGAGTVLRVYTKVWGREAVYHQAVTEPEPGRTVVETDIETGQYTQFTFDSVNGGQQTRVTISSMFPLPRGIEGMMARLMQPGIVRRIYNQELDNLAEYVRAQASKN